MAKKAGAKYASVVLAGASIAFEPDLGPAFAFGVRALSARDMMSSGWLGGWLIG
jgi:hypothetical protein